MNRRLFLRGPLAGVAAAVGAGALLPRSVDGSWPSELFERDRAAGLIEALAGDSVQDSDRVRVMAPEIAENGASVSIPVETDLDGVESISIIVPENPRPLIAIFEPGERFAGSVEIRIKMAESSDVIALVRTSRGDFMGASPVKVTRGGCGG